MEDAPLPLITTPKEVISEFFEIKQDKKNYKLNIEIINQDIILNLLDLMETMKEYEIKITLNELKQIHKIFLMFNSCQEFLDYMKALIQNNKLTIKKTSEKQITIELMVEYLFKQNIIKIDLNQKKINFELVSQDLYKKISSLTLKYQKIVEENKLIKEENKNLNKEIINLKEENKNIKIKINKLDNIIESLGKEITLLKEINNNLNSKIELKNSINSSIIENTELDMINTAIKKIMNKEIKSTKKLYQATVDGGEPNIFHKKCDNIQNTLILYKSAGNRRFGAFASKCWSSQGNDILDENCFLFSLDKKKIYFPKNNNFEMACYKYDGPSFLEEGTYIIRIKNALQKKTLKTNEKEFKEIFDGDVNALSEDGYFEGIYAKDYEVYQLEL